MPHNELDMVLSLGRLTPLYQPVIACREASVFGYEALIRGPSDSPLHSPLNLFDAASRAGRLAELDLLCRQVAIRQFAQLALPGRLFLNVTPQVVVEKDFPTGATLAFLAEAGLAPERVVIELTEQFPIHDYDVMRAAVEHYRAIGLSIAIDDLGAGYSSLRHWSELKPDFVKLDRHFVQGVDQDSGKRQFIRSILELSKSMGSRVIAEGIETLEEYRNLWSMGLELGQGYYFARPQACPPRVIGNLLPANGQASPKSRLGETVGRLARPVPPVPPDLRAEAVASLFAQSPDLRYLPVVEKETVVGLILRNEFLGLFAGQYGRAVYGKRPAGQLARRDMLVVPEDTAVEELSQRLTGMTELAGDEGFIIVDQAGRYRGMGDVLSLLRRITELQIRNARYANPLSGLPGNVPISERISELLAAETSFVAVYIDLDNFKAFNDCYGYSKGDDVIVALARAVEEQADPQRDFAGHVGGDDFILIFRSSDWRERCERLLKVFAETAPWFYDAADREAGGIRSQDRRGKTHFFPLMTLSLAALRVTPGAFTSRHEIAAVLSDLKRQAKRIPGNSLFVDRRGHGGEESAGRVSA